MKLRNDKMSVWVGVVCQTILIGLAIGLVIVLMMPNSNDSVVRAILASTITLIIIGVLAVGSFLGYKPSLSFFGPRLTSRKTDYYEIKPVYYNKNGPKGSDAVICLVRSSVKLKWQPKIVALNHFIPEEAGKIRDLFNFETGEAVQEKYSTIKVYSAQNGKILLFAEPKESQEEISDASIIRESDPNPVIDKSEGPVIEKSDNQGK